MRNRRDGWGAGLTTLVCMANLLDAASSRRSPARDVSRTGGGRRGYRRSAAAFCDQPAARQRRRNADAEAMVAQLRRGSRQRGRRALHHDRGPLRRRHPRTGRHDVRRRDRPSLSHHRPRSRLHQQGLRSARSWRCTIWPSRCWRAWRAATPRPIAWKSPTRGAIRSTWWRICERAFESIPAALEAGRRSQPGSWSGRERTGERWFSARIRSAIADAMLAALGEGASPATWRARLPMPPRFGSRASTSATSSATGTPRITASPLPMRSIRRSRERRQPSCCAACSTPR